MAERSDELGAKGGMLLGESQGEVKGNEYKGTFTGQGFINEEED